MTGRNSFSALDHVAEPAFGGGEGFGPPRPVWRRFSAVNLKMPGRANLFVKRVFPVGCNKIVKAFDKGFSCAR